MRTIVGKKTKKLNIKKYKVGKKVLTKEKKNKARCKYLDKKETNIKKIHRKSEKNGIKRF